jgi:hypothetical protein
MDKKKTDQSIVSALSRVKGIRQASPVADGDRTNILALEKKAEERALMGLGKVVNTGVLEVLDQDLIYAALTDMDFDWGCAATLVLKKGDTVVGEEVRDEAVIAELSNRKNVWFMHRNFVIYKDRVSFPQDIMKKVCHFEIPCLPAEWCILEDDQLQCRNITYANPSTLCDVFLKEQYFDRMDEKGFGTILVGVKF